MSARGHLPRPITSTLSFRLQGAREKGQGGHTTAVPLPGGHHLPLPKLTSHELPPPRGAPRRVCPKGTSLANTDAGCSTSQTTRGACLWLPGDLDRGTPRGQGGGVLCKSRSCQASGSGVSCLGL